MRLSVWWYQQIDRGTNKIFMLSIRDVLVNMSSMNRLGRREYFKKNRKNLLEAGITWAMIASQFVGKGVIINK